jgi:hypothetical protein
MHDPDLDDLFATARRNPPAVPSGLMARVMADAGAMAPQAARPVRVAAPGLWARMLAAIGGAPALAGLSTAMLAGVWIGFSQPVALAGVTELLLATASMVEPLDIIPTFDDFATEG